MVKDTTKNPRIELTVSPEDFDDLWRIAKAKRFRNPQDLIRSFVRTLIEENPAQKRKDRVN